MNNIKNLLIVGSGATGSSTYHMLKQSPDFMKNYKVHLWDKANGAGGRMSTKRLDSINCFSFTIDLGAQYFSLNTEHFTKFPEIYKNLISSKLLQLIDGNEIVNSPSYAFDIKHYIAPQGSNSIIKHFLKDPDNVQFNRSLNSIKILNNQCYVKCNNDENSIDIPFDIVILTCPVPQILNINGISEILNEEVERNLRSVEYSSRFALGVLYNTRPEWINNIPVIQYVSNSASDLLAYIAIDTDKRFQNRSEENVSICVHSRAFPFGKDNIEKLAEEIKPELLKELKRLYPEMSEPSGVICHKWRYSQFHKSLISNTKSMAIMKEPHIIIGGDGIIGGSGFHNCLLSAQSICEYVFATCL